MMTQIQEQIPQQSTPPPKENVIYPTSQLPTQFTTQLQKHTSSMLDETQQQVSNITEKYNVKP